MELPRKMPGEQKYRKMLGEFYDANKNKQWFERAELIEQHPTHFKPTLEIYSNYNPVLEMKELLEFTTKYDLALEIVPTSHN